MFSQKVGKEKKEKEEKAEVIMLMQVKDFQNISIMMHKVCHQKKIGNRAHRLSRAPFLFFTNTPPSRPADADCARHPARRAAA